MRLAEIVADQLAQDIEDSLQPTDAPPPDPMPAALYALTEIIAETDDLILRDRLQAIHQLIAGTPTSIGHHIGLATPELDPLRLVPLGSPNAEVAATHGLTQTTVTPPLPTAPRRPERR